MLAKHSAIYLIARGVPGLIGFATIIIYTRLLSPESYGQYSLVVTGAVVLNAVLYQWLRASLLRFLPEQRQDEQLLLSAIYSGYLVMCFLVGAVGWLLTFVEQDPAWDFLVFIGVLLVWAQAWFTINLEILRSQLAPIQFGIATLAKALVALGVGIAFIKWGIGASGALLGLLVGFLSAGLWASWGKWAGLKSLRCDGKMARKLLSYGLPLSVSFALAVLISSTDRFMLAGMIGESATGLFAAGQGLAQQAVGVSMTMVNLAAYPLIVRTLENVGPDAAREQLRKNLILLLGAGLPVATVFVVLSPDISAVFLGAEFRQAGSELMPWFAFAALLASFRAYYYDLAFYLGKRTRIQMVVMVSALVLNIILNFLLIPNYGILGAVIASVGAHGLAITLSALVGRYAFRLPKVHGDIARLLVASLVMALTLFMVSFSDGVLALILSIAVGGGVYLGLVLVLNVGGAKDFVSRLLGQVSEVFRRG